MCYQDLTVVQRENTHVWFWFGLQLVRKVWSTCMVVTNQQSILYEATTKISLPNNRRTSYKIQKINIKNFYFLFFLEMKTFLVSKESPTQHTEFHLPFLKS